MIIRNYGVYSTMTMLWSLLVSSDGFTSVPHPMNSIKLPQATADPVTASRLNMSDSESLSDATKKAQKPGIMTEKETKLAAQILEEIADGTRKYPEWYYKDYQEEDIGDDAEDSDPDAIDPETLGKWDPSDLETRLEYEFDVDEGDEDPNDLDPQFQFLESVELDDEGIEVGYDPIYGSSNPIDERTIINPQDSYVIDDQTRDDSMVTPAFRDGDLEIQENADITTFRRSLNIVQTYTDPFLEMEVPRYRQRWYGYPEKGRYPDRDPLENRFTDKKDATDFDNMTPYRARKLAVQFARAKNNEWLPKGKSASFHNAKTNVYGKLGLKVGSLMKGDIDTDVKESIQPALDVLGSCVDLLETNGTVFRFHYHGLIKNKRGMAAWTETLIRDCGVECTGVVFETGWRKRDPYYDSGDKWFGPY